MRIVVLTSLGLACVATASAQVFTPAQTGFQLKMAGEQRPGNQGLLGGNATLQLNRYEVDPRGTGGLSSAGAQTRWLASADLRFNDQFGAGAWYGQGNMDIKT